MNDLIKGLAKKKVKVMKLHEGEYPAMTEPEDNSDSGKSKKHWMQQMQDMVDEIKKVPFEEHDEESVPSLDSEMDPRSRKKLMGK